MTTIDNERFRRVWASAAPLFEGNWPEGFPAIDDTEHPRHAEVKALLIEFLERIDVAMAADPARPSPKP